MACTSCMKKKPNKYQDLKALDTPPFRASDIYVYTVSLNEYRKFSNSDWQLDKPVVLLFTQSVSDIVVTGEPTKSANFIYVTSQPIHQIHDYLTRETPSLEIDTIFSSYLLPSRLNLIHNGNTRKAVVYIMPDGDMVKQELFFGSAFNFTAINQYLDDYKNTNH